LNNSTQKLLGALAVAALVGVAGPATGAAQEATPEAEYRESVMESFGLHIGAVRAVLAGAAPAGHIEHHAVAFERMTQALANAFPEGSGQNTRALPVIWENRDDFMNKVSDIQTVSAHLVTAARSGDSDAIAAAVQEVRDSCRDCHTTYRAPRN